MSAIHVSIGSSWQSGKPVSGSMNVVNGLSRSRISDIARFNVVELRPPRESPNVVHGNCLGRHFSAISEHIPDSTLCTVSIRRAGSLGDQQQQ
ncbi:MAG: hypothetical protein M3414_04625 [Pseudomonadota bacterium]|nr:hypothetical protein [Pseudomonadota bacterium]